jgi:hypothetical protein
MRITSSKSAHGAQGLFRAAAGQGRDKNWTKRAQMLGEQNEVRRNGGRESAAARSDSGVPRASRTRRFLSRVRAAQPLSLH